MNKDDNLQAQRSKTLNSKRLDHAAFGRQEKQKQENYM